MVDSLGWGLVLWAVGFLIGFALGPRVSFDVGWIVLAVLIPLTAAVSYVKLRSISLVKVTLVALVWTGVAVILDYLLIVGYVPNYYDLSVLVYYPLTFIIPLAVWRTTSHP